MMKMKRFLFNTGRLRFGRCVTPNAPLTIAVMEKLRRAIKCSLIIAAGFLSMFAVKAQTQTPGGVSADYLVWLTPDTYNDGVWTNKITTGTTLGNFSRTQSPLTGTVSAPKVVGYNFQPAVKFAATGYTVAPNQMESSTNFNIGAGESFTIFVVAKKGTSNNGNQDFILGYGNTGTYATQGLYYTSSSNALNIGWPVGTGRSLGTANPGLITVDNPNSANTVRLYSNGAAPTGVNASNSSVNYPLRIGSLRYDGGGERGFNGEMQEIIIVKRTGTGATNGYMSALDIQKIQSYLAIKYGISLNNGSNVADDNYLTSASLSTTNNVVWGRIANNGFNNNIFGIGHDDASGLHQVQSRSVANNLTTLFVGNKVENLNSTALLNGASLPDGTYVMLGSNGQVNPEAENILNDTWYNHNTQQINATNGLNIRSKTIYRAQVTGPASIQVKLKVALRDYTYVFVSNTPGFLPDDTRIYPINSDGIAPGVELNTGDYIRYAGYATGPGGIGVTSLRLWLRADDEGSLELQTTPIGNGKLANFGFANGASEVETVWSWTDAIRDQTYSYNAGSSADTHRLPVYERSSPLTNFYPGVRFWGSLTNAAYSAYLTNTGSKNITSVAIPVQHTAYFLVNNNFASNAWIYALMFGSTTPNVSAAAYYGPGYGMHRLPNAPFAGNVVGRFRTSATAGSGGVDLFNPGSTSIVGYYVDYGGSSTSTNNKVKFRFNGKEDSQLHNGDAGGYPNLTNYTAGSMSLWQPSILGTGYDNDRALQGVISEAIILEQNLTSDEQTALESYMAIKYGITLRPSTTLTNRFDYRFSKLQGQLEGTAFFPGNSSADPKYTTYYNNIAAVIRDDASALYNKQAHSTNAGSLLHIGVAGTGSAGTSFGKNAEFGELNDREALVWGNDIAQSISALPKQDCADFDYIFDAKWFVHKITENDRALPVIIGAEYNLSNSLGSDPSTYKGYYNQLTAGNNVFLAVADNPDSLRASSFNPKFVVPMQYINGEHQCLYTFRESDTYITFGYRQNKKGCPSEVEFMGTKTLDWSKSWTRKNYALTGTGYPAGGKTVPNATGYTDNLGDDNLITATTKITYPVGVHADTYYPSFTSSPRGGLQLTRNRGTLNDKVMVTITFNHPVIPAFSISGLDSRSRQYDAVNIYAKCTADTGTLAVSNIMPTLTYAGKKQDALYEISGGSARVNKNRTASATDNNGKVNVTFENGVTEITIEYTMANYVTTANQQIYISPVSVRNVPPAAPVNEDGLSFTKQVKEREITTCEPVEYSFFIGNTTFTNKYIQQFRDTLPTGMKWVINAVGLDTINADPAYNPSLKIRYETVAGDRHVLIIDSLFIPCTSVTQVTATAVLDDTAPSGDYSNRAAIAYERIWNSTSFPALLQSVDREIPSNPYTTFYAEKQQRNTMVGIDAQVSPTKYTAGQELLVTLTLTNGIGNAPIDSMFLDVNWDAGFIYVNNSYTSPVGVRYANDSTTLSIGGNATGSTGFTLPIGTTTFTFKLKAPASGELEPMYDESGVLVPGQKATLHIGYNFTSGDDNPCVIESISDLSGELEVPYTGARMYIITNKHVTTKLKK